MSDVNIEMIFAHARRHIGSKAGFDPHKVIAVVREAPEEHHEDLVMRLGRTAHQEIGEGAATAIREAFTLG